MQYPAGSGWALAQPEAEDDAGGGVSEMLVAGKIALREDDEERRDAEGEADDDFHQQFGGIRDVDGRDGRPGDTVYKGKKPELEGTRCRE